jgi:hypothetical protein
MPVTKLAEKEKARAFSALASPALYLPRYFAVKNL